MQFNKAMLKVVKFLKQPLVETLSGNYNKKCLTHEFWKNISYSLQKLSINVENEVKCDDSLNCKETNNNNSKNNSNVDKKKKLQILKLEIDVARQEGRKVPDPEFIKEHYWEHLLSLNSRSTRNKFYSFLWKLEKTKENRQFKKMKSKAETKLRKKKEKIELIENDHINYGLMHTTFLLRIYDTSINQWNNNKLIRAMQFGQKLILDCSYDNHMTSREAINAAKQLMLCFAENRMHDEPFDLHFCNANLNGITMEYLRKHIPILHEPSFPLNLHEKCFMELFPKEKLVYLTPHCRTNLNQFNPHDIYIIGAMVDKINYEPLSLAKAKRLGLRMARLPLDKYLQWSSGSGKSLTLNQMTKILLDLKKTNNDWSYSLRHVPKRKLANFDYVEKESNKIKHRVSKFKHDFDNIEK